MAGCCRCSGGEHDPAAAGVAELTGSGAGPCGGSYLASPVSTGANADACRYVLLRCKHLCTLTCCIAGFGRTIVCKNARACLSQELPRVPLHFAVSYRDNLSCCG